MDVWMLHGCMDVWMDMDMNGYGCMDECMDAYNVWMYMDECMDAYNVWMYMDANLEKNVWLEESFIFLILRRMYG